MQTNEKEIKTPEELKLEQLCGKKNPFCVPEGYFEMLPSTLQRRIAYRHRMRTIRQWSIAAIMAGCVCTVGLSLWYHSLEPEDNPPTVAYEVDELDYIMANNMDIEFYLTEAE